VYIDGEGQRRIVRRNGGPKRRHVSWMIQPFRHTIVCVLTNPRVLEGDERKQTRRRFAVRSLHVTVETVGNGGPGVSMAKGSRKKGKGAPCTSKQSAAFTCRIAADGNPGTAPVLSFVWTDLVRFIGLGDSQAAKFSYDLQPHYGKLMPLLGCLPHLGCAFS
jgi:hypothetical protein